MSHLQLAEQAELNSGDLKCGAEKPFAKSARERDIDHFLMEEMQASPDFREWFVGHLNDFTPHVMFTHERHVRPVASPMTARRICGLRIIMKPKRCSRSY